MASPNMGASKSGAIKMSPTKFSVGGMTQQPRSFADFLTGKSTVNYNRPAKPAVTQKTVNKTFKAKPVSNGKGVGM